MTATNTGISYVEEEMCNIQELSIDAFIEMMLESYLSCIKKGIPVGKEGEPPFLWGATGIGKSDGIRELARRLEKESGKKVIVLDIRLATQSPMDIKGLLLPSEDRKSSVYTPLKTYQFEDREDLIYILFYDELTSAPLAIQSAAYEIIRDRKIDQNHFPDNVIIIAAGNRMSDKGLTYRMLRPLANRFEHYQITTGFAAWEKWAVSNEVHPLVIEYLRNHPNKLSKEEINANDLAFTTPRAWGNVSDRMNQLYEPDQRYTLTLQRRIAGTIGVSEERAFHHWINVGRNMPLLTDIVKGKCKIYPKTPDMNLAVINALLNYLQERMQSASEKDTLSVAVLENICNYASHFPTDYRKMFHNQMMGIKGLEGMLIKTSGFQLWMKNM